MSFFDSCPGSKRIKEPFPENNTCGCGREIEIWSDEEETACPHCKKKVNRVMPKTCLDWCGMARECVGDDKFRKHFKQKEV
ncbi:MAG: hypothetical protein WC569_01335 [Candidatus Omnitrophota bacterium]